MATGCCCSAPPMTANNAAATSGCPSPAPNQSPIPEQWWHHEPALVMVPTAMANPATTNAQDVRDRQTREARLTQRLVVAVRGPQNQLHDTSGHKKHRRIALPARPEPLRCHMDSVTATRLRSPRMIWARTPWATAQRKFAASSIKGTSSKVKRPVTGALPCLDSTPREKSPHGCTHCRPGITADQNHVEQCRQPNQ